MQGLLPCVLFGQNAAKLGVLQDDNPCGQFCCMCTCACERTQQTAVMCRRSATDGACSRSCRAPWLWRVPETWVF